MNDAIVGLKTVEFHVNLKFTPLIKSSRLILLSRDLTGVSDVNVIQILINLIIVVFRWKKLHFLNVFIFIFN